MQRWNVVQHELIPELNSQVGALTPELNGQVGAITPKLEKVIYTLEWARIEEFVTASWQGNGRPPHDRGVLANAFVAKAVLGLVTTTALIERLHIDRALRRICGFSMYRKLPDAATFSRAFGEFAEAKLAERVHEALIKQQLGQTLIGHISRDGTAITAREKPAKKPTQRINATNATNAANATNATKPKRGRPSKGDERAPKINVLTQQLSQSLTEIRQGLPNRCDRGTKCNAQGYKTSWNGYKLHLDTADTGIVISALLTSASVHDSQTAIPLSLMSHERVTSCYDLMDAAYCSDTIRSHSKSLGHVPLIDHNPRGGEKREFDPAEAQRYKGRTQAERTNARLKDEYGARTIYVQGPVKVMSHLMFGVLALSVDQLMRLLN